MSGIKRASTKIDPADEAKIVELRKGGLGMMRIADQVGKSSATVHKVLVQHKLDGDIGDVPGIAAEVDERMDGGLTAAARKAVSAWKDFAAQAKRLIAEAGALDVPADAPIELRIEAAKARAAAMAVATKAMAVVVKSGDAALKWRQLLRGRPTSHSKNERVPDEPAMTPEEKAEMERIERLQAAQAAAQ